MSVRQMRFMAQAVLLSTCVPALLGSIDLSANREQRLLAAHNIERQAHGLKPLTWDPRLAQAAQRWAVQLQQDGDLYHSDPASEPDLQGENLWAGTRGAFSPDAMVGAWIAEKRHYTPGIFPNVSTTGQVGDVGHYTQVVWSRTGQVGCAVAENAREEFLVCRYSSAGNVIGARPF